MAIGGPLTSHHLPFPDVRQLPVVIGVSSELPND